MVWSDETNSRRKIIKRKSEAEFRIEGKRKKGQERSGYIRKWQYRLISFLFRNYIKSVPNVIKTVSVFFIEADLVRKETKYTE